MFKWFIEELDVDGDNMISFDEFEKAMKEEINIRKHRENIEEEYEDEEEEYDD